MMVIVEHYLVRLLWVLVHNDCGNCATTSQGTVDALKVYDMFKPPSGGTNQRPPAKRVIFYNFDFKTIEFFDGNSWRQVDNTTRSSR